MSISQKSSELSYDKEDCLENVIKFINSGKTLEEVFDIYPISTSDHLDSVKTVINKYKERNLQNGFSKYVNKKGAFAALADEKSTFISIGSPFTYSFKNFDKESGLFFPYRSEGEKK
tara:strand:- start:543 stop:893 length:351 start_codon:yes stop_codon:yes gene_type:complete